MSKDIVDRLRASHPERPADVWLDAAREIERLRKELKLVSEDHAMRKEEYVDSRRQWEAKIADRDAEIKQLMDGMELAWVLIANAADVAGDGKVQRWQEAMERWRDEHWHPSLDRNGYTRESEVNDD
jgi:hypothetical protein